jgi:hypothetical protein
MGQRSHGGPPRSMPPLTAMPAVEAGQPPECAPPTLAYPPTWYVGALSEAITSLYGIPPASVGERLAGTDELRAFGVERAARAPLPPSMVEIHAVGEAEPVAVFDPAKGMVTATRVVREPDELTAMQALAQAYNHEHGVLHSPAGCALCEPPPACRHRERVPVNLLAWPYDHVADLCASCYEAFPVAEDR